jgi:hypothetical protein
MRDLLWAVSTPLASKNAQRDKPLRVAFDLEQHIQDLAFRINSPPEIHLFATNTDEHFVEMPPSMRLGALHPQPACDRWTEGEDPSPDALVGVVTLSSAGATSCTSANVRPGHRPQSATPRTLRRGSGGECEQRRDDEER